MISKNNLSLSRGNQSRRKFIYNAATAMGAGMVLSLPLISHAAKLTEKPQSYTVKQIIDLFMKQVPGAPFPNTVDTLKSGSMDTVVTGIVTTMFATIDVIRKTIDLGANFIIVHEPTFYNHLDATEWIKDDDVLQYKIDLLNKHDIAIWRNHDTIHQLKPDGVTKGVLEQLEWQQYAGKDIPNILTFPPTSLKDLITHAKDKLHIEKVRFIGDPNQSCTKVLFIPGAAGGTRQIQSIGKVKPDVLFCGEIAEWETAEYVRDARAKGDNISLVVLGHIASEEPGSAFMFQWLRDNVPSVKATHIYCENSLTFM
ncbi:MAG: Nif3-like dinuclear metal center hexameric protein [Mucilaginibacter sp.]|nr:Nif3-like dinuclear metal center hexameric protein [Mucilaginibacter sp.]